MTFHRLRGFLGQSKSRNGRRRTINDVTPFCGPFRALNVRYLRHLFYTRGVTSSYVIEGGLLFGLVVGRLYQQVIMALSLVGRRRALLLRLVLEGLQVRCGVKGRIRDSLYVSD